MKFGKVLDKSLLQHIDFSLPEIHPSTYEQLPGTPAGNPRIRFGATGWGTDEWKGIIYPSGLAKKNYLSAYSKSFETIELNSTHYTIPKVSTVLNWKTQTGENFKFCPKVVKYISHSRNLGTDNDRIMEFCDAIAHFEDKLGMCFMQLPPYWNIDRLPVLELFLEKWPKEIPLAIEFRHPDIYEDENFNKLFEVLEDHDTEMVLTDVSGARYMLHLRLNSPKLMVRWVGNDLHHTDYDRLDEWAFTLHELLQLGLEEVYFFPHQPDNIRPPHTVEYLSEQLKSTNLKLDLRQISWTNRDNQLLLF